MPKSIFRNASLAIAWVRAWLAIPLLCASLAIPWLWAPLAVLLLCAPLPASALPVFAHRFGLACQACHTVVPHLTPYGQAFMDAGYRLPGLVARPAFPIAIRANLAYTNEPDPSGLPKAIVDEIEVLTGGTAGSNLSYFFEQYLVDGGTPGTTRDAWLALRPADESQRHVPYVLTGGQFTLPVPVDPETFRETASHYAVFDQTVGANAFNFFDPKVGAMLRVGNPAHGASVDFAALSGHDKQSGLPSDGTDRMFVLHDALRGVVASAYRYEGTRPLGRVADDFWRQGFGLTLRAGKASVDGILQTGFDRSADGLGTRAGSSGGFGQLRWEFSSASYAIARLDGTNDPSGFARALTLLGGRRFSANTRFTLEDVLTHQPATKNTLNAQFTIAY